MEFEQPLLKLPVRFSPETLEAEVRNLPASAWVEHPDSFPGNSAVRLITRGGDATDDLYGEMQPTEHLLACPYILQIMADLGGTWGRSRLMGLAPGAQVPAHADTHYYWRTHLRIHIPVITNPGVLFTCGGETVHMAAGECWVFDSFQRHDVQNRGDSHRVHLVLDTAGGGRLWDLVQQAACGRTEPAFVAPEEPKVRALRFERVNAPTIMSPFEMRGHIGFLLDKTAPQPSLDAIVRRLDRLTFEWSGLWACYGERDEGRPAYREALAATGRDLRAIPGGDSVLLKNELPLFLGIQRLVFEMAMSHGQPSAPVGASHVTARRLAS